MEKAIKGIVKRAFEVIDKGKKRQKKKFLLWESEEAMAAGDPPTIEIEVSAAHIRIACMNGRHRAVILSNVVAAYLRRYRIQVKINYLGAMYEGCMPCYLKPRDQWKNPRKALRRDTRGTCGCYIGPHYCKFQPGCSAEENQRWVE
eukprot:1264142-Karenia_brevis.AAC.1